MTFISLAAKQSVEFERRPSGPDDLTITISGDHTPMIDIDLGPGQGMIARLSGLMQSDAGLEIRPWDGISDKIVLLFNAHGSNAANMTLTTGDAGMAGVFDLAQHGGHLLCPQRALLAAGPDVAVKVYSHYRGLGSNGFDLLLLEGNGRVVLRAGGDVTETRLTPGKRTRVNIAALAAMSATVDFDPLGKTGAHGSVEFARLTGPGHVWLQSGVLRD